MPAIGSPLYSPDAPSKPVIFYVPEFYSPDLSNKITSAPANCPDLSSVPMETGQMRLQKRHSGYFCSNLLIFWSLSFQLFHHQISFLLMKMQNLPLKSVYWSDIDVYNFSRCCYKKGMFFYHVGSKHQTQIARHGCKLLPSKPFENSYFRYLS